MKNAIYGLLAMLLLFGVACTSAATAEANNDEEAESTAVYACPMFCDEWLTTDPDAKCPVCNMDVEKVEELYVCPDHPDEFSLEADSECAESGEAFIPVEELYVCPMHPDEISADSNDECNICGMDLVAVGFGPACSHVCGDECVDGCTHVCDASCGHHDAEEDDHDSEETSGHSCGGGH